MSKPVNPYARAWAAFLDQTTTHELRILHDDGFYRHLRIQEPGTRMWSWDITTWPGHLATSGDVADGYMFTREPDMLEFFAHGGHAGHDIFSDGAPRIDVRYWAQKLCGGRSREVTVYSPDIFLQQVREHLEEHEDIGTEAQEHRDQQLKLLKLLHTMRGLDKTTSQQLLETHWEAETLLATTTARRYSLAAERYRRSARDALARLWDAEMLSDVQFATLDATFDWLELAGTEVPQTPLDVRREEIIADAQWSAGCSNEAHGWLADNEEFVGSDTWEWDLTEYDFHFLLTCYCIDHAVKLYRKHTAAITAA